MSAPGGISLEICGAASSHFPPKAKPVQPAKGGQVLQLTHRPNSEPSKVPKWRAEALAMLHKVPTCSEDDRKVLETVSLQTPEAQMAALHLILGYKQPSDYLGRDHHNLDLTNSDTMNNNRQLLDSWLVSATEHYAASLDRIRSNGEIANFHQLVFGSMCSILSDRGITDANRLLRKYLGKSNISDKHCGFYLRGALWVNSFVRELYSRNWKGRIELLFLLCKQVESFFFSYLCTSGNLPLTAYGRLAEHPKEALELFRRTLLPQETQSRQPSAQSCNTEQIGRPRVNELGDTWLFSLPFMVYSRLKGRLK